MRYFWKRVFGWRYCGTHDEIYRSDFCGRCFKARLIREDATDRRRNARSEGNWPIKKEA